MLWSFPALSSDSPGLPSVLRPHSYSCRVRSSPKGSSAGWVRGCAVGPRGKKNTLKTHTRIKHRSQSQHEAHCTWLSSAGNVTNVYDFGEQYLKKTKFFFYENTYLHEERKTKHNTSCRTRLTLKSFLAVFFIPTFRLGGQLISAHQDQINTYRYPSAVALFNRLSLPPLLLLCAGGII